MDGFTNNVRGLLTATLNSIEKKNFPLLIKVTVIVFLVIGSIGTIMQFFSDPMQCFDDQLQPSTEDNSCRSQSMYLNAAFSLDVMNPYYDTSKMIDSNEEKHFAYYKWMFAGIFLQAILLGTPYLVWKVYQIRNSKKLINVFLSERTDCEDNNQVSLIDYFFTPQRFVDRYVYVHYSFGLLNLLNVVVQICIMNAFVGDTFGSEGLYRQMLGQQSETNFWDFVHQRFPTFVMCEREGVDPVGIPNILYDVCVVGQNLVSSRIYVFVWLWLHAVAIISASVFVYRVFTLLCPSIKCYRLSLTKWTVTPNDRDVLLNKLPIGKRFLLQMLQRHMTNIAYNELISCISQRSQGDALDPISKVKVEIYTFSEVEL